jgi:hypothetical protein
LIPGQPEVPVYPRTYRGEFPDPDASTARSLTLAAIILQALLFLLFVFVFGFFFMIPFGGGLPVFGFMAGIFTIGLFTGILWVILDYFLVYANLSNEVRFPRARTPALVLGIIQLLTGGVVSGVLLIIAYVKIGDSLRARGTALY